tara:strand:- start:98 stop:262 length:165 start_codon:yes stop_codon:yes gene_type:complete
MTTAILKVAKSVVSDVENLRETEIISKSLEVIDFILHITLPFALPIAILSSYGI